MSDDVGGFGTMPDTTGHHVGDTWSVTKNGFTTTYTIPEGNGTNTVDQTLTTSSGAQVGQMRIATDGHGATQKWGDYNGGSASYTSQDSPSGPTYNQLYNPGSSTSGAPNSVNAVLPGENHAIPLIQDGQRVGLLTTVDEGGGLSKNVYQDKDGNHYIYRSNPTEHGDMVTNQIGQLDKAGNGWLVGGYPQGGAPGYGLLWKVTATPDGNPILTNDEKTNSGQHFRVQNPDGTATDRYVGNDPYNSFTSVRDATGLTTKVGTDGSFTQWNANGEVLIHRDGTPKPEEPDNRSNWEKLWDGTGNILKGAWHGLEHVGTGVENLTGFNGGDAFDHAWDSVWGGIGNVGKEFWGDAKGFFPGLYHIGNDIYNMTGINGHDAITDSAFDLLAKTAGPGLSLALPVLDIVDAAQGKPVGWGTFGKDLLYGLNGVSEMVIGTDWSHFNEHPGATIGDALFGTALIMAPKGLRAIGVTDAVTSAAVATMDRIGMTDAAASVASATRDLLGSAGTRLPALLDAIGVKLPGFNEAKPGSPALAHPDVDGDLASGATDPHPHGAEPTPNSPGERSIAPGVNSTPLSPYLQALQRDLGINWQAGVDGFVVDQMAHLDAELAGVQARTPALSAVVNSIRDGIRNAEERLGIGAEERRIGDPERPEPGGGDRPPPVKPPHDERPGGGGFDEGAEGNPPDAGRPAGDPEPLESPSKPAKPRRDRPPWLRTPEELAREKALYEVSPTDETGLTRIVPGRSTKANPHPRPWRPKTFRGLSNPTRGLIGEALTRARLRAQGYDILAEQVEIRLPSGEIFKPDFLAIKDGKVVMVDSKMGRGAGFTENQLPGYEHYAGGSSKLNLVDADLAAKLKARGITDQSVVDRVEVDRWNSQLLPSADMLKAAARDFENDWLDQHQSAELSDTAKQAQRWLQNPDNASFLQNQLDAAAGAGGRTPGPGLAPALLPALVFPGAAWGLGQPDGQHGDGSDLQQTLGRFINDLPAVVKPYLPSTQLAGQGAQPVAEQINQSATLNISIREPDFASRADRLKAHAAIAYRL
ncbi:hypothetical protein AB0L82_27320 [Nocardia sp. NPDC052001]|uniref:hypothetical protein n=1 Tax=Nocardia sp. NPDC052001 TaxID=3154853 RepID=UPI00342BD6E5